MPSLVADFQVPAGWNPCNSKQKTRLASFGLPDDTRLHDRSPRTDRRSSGVSGEIEVRRGRDLVVIGGVLGAA